MDEDPVSYLRRYVRSVHILSLPLLCFYTLLQSLTLLVFIFLTFQSSFPFSHPSCYLLSISSLLNPPFLLIILSSSTIICSPIFSCRELHIFILFGVIQFLQCSPSVTCAVQSFIRMYMYSSYSFISTT